MAWFENPSENPVKPGKSPVNLGKGIWVTLGALEDINPLNKVPFTGLFSNQGEKSINFYFIMVPLRKEVLKYGTPKPGLREPGVGLRRVLFKGSPSYSLSFRAPGHPRNDHRRGATHGPQLSQEVMKSRAQGLRVLSLSGL